MSQEQITLYITQTSADKHGDWEVFKRSGTGWGWKTIAATLSAHDGSVDHGYKVSMRKDGRHMYYL